MVGLVATGLWAVDGVYDVVDGDRRRDGPKLSPTDPFVDHCGVSLFAVACAAPVPRLAAKASASTPTPATVVAVRAEERDLGMGMCSSRFSRGRRDEAPGRT